MKGNLLIVDDEALILDNLSHLLEDYADDIFITLNGREALKIIDENKVHCVICDLNMPPMSGLELIEAVRKKGIQIPFIFYTAFANQQMIAKVSQYGTFDFLQKPLFEGLEDTVIRALRLGLTQQSHDESDFKTQFKKLLEDNRDYS